MFHLPTTSSSLGARHTHRRGTLLSCYLSPCLSPLPQVRIVEGGWSEAEDSSCEQQVPLRYIFSLL